MLAYPSPEGGTPRGASVASAVDSKRISRTLLAAPVSWVRASLGQPMTRLMGTDGGRSVRRRRGGFSPTTSPAETLIPSAPIDSRPVRGACTPEAGQPAMPAPSG